MLCHYLESNIYKYFPWVFTSLWFDLYIHIGFILGVDTWNKVSYTSFTFVYFLVLFRYGLGYNFNKYVHGILLGITIQGLNFYSLDNFHLFYIPYTIYPNIYHLIFLYSTIIMASVMIIASRSRIIRGGAEGSTIAEDRA